MENEELPPLSTASEEVLQDLLLELIDDQCLNLSFEIHRACVKGYFLIGDTDPESDTKFALIRAPGVDVLGQTPNKQNFECQCPKCFRYQAASRFAPHLEKCMGMGRKCSRIAYRRIANNTKRDSEESGGDDENDNDWSYGTEYKKEYKKVKKMKKDKGVNSPRSKKAGKLKNGVSHAASNGPHSSQESVESLSEATVDSMTPEEIKEHLRNYCGVISAKKKMCTRTLRCPQHSEEQKQLVRLQLLAPTQPPAEREDTLVDIDTYDDTDTRSLRESLQWEASSNSSPADSNSTNNSTTSTHKRPAKNSRHNGSSKSKKKSSSKPSSSSSSRDSAASLYHFPS
ncbi:hypothetical protein ACOMHN_061039 [Nucella lapillus]